MKHLQTRIENFLTIGDSGWLFLDGRGLVLVQGVNNDDTSAKSNGSGKSSLPDAISWCNYGVTARGESGDAIINDKAKKNCRVTNIYQEGDAIYEIIRHRKHSTFKNQTVVRFYSPAANYPTGAFVDMTKGTEKETQDMIDRDILGCSHDVFVASIYAGQESMPDLPKMTDKQLKVLVEEAAGVDRLENAYKLACNRANDIERNVIAQRGKVERINANIVSTKASLHNNQVNFDAFEASRPVEAATHRANCESYAAQLKVSHASYTALGVEALKAEQADINTKLADHSKYAVEHRRLLDVANNLRNVANGLQRDYDTTKREVERAIAELKNAPEEMKKPCTECGKPHTADELDQFIAHIKERAKRHGTNAAIINGQLVDATMSAKGADQAATDYALTIPDVSALTARNMEITRILNNANAIATNMRNAKSLFDSEKAAAERCMTAVNPYKSAIDTLTDTLAKCEAELTEVKMQLTASEEELAIAQDVAKVFSPGGVRAHILDTVTPFLNERTAEYLNALSDGNISAVWSTLAETAKGELREKFNIEVEHAKGGKSFGLISGGEKRKVRLACMLALQDLVASRATKPIDLYMADEIDDALDAPAIERLMGILETKAREKGTVIVISHNELRDWIDQTVTVTKEGGISRVEGALS